MFRTRDFLFCKQLLPPLPVILKRESRPLRGIISVLPSVQSKIFSYSVREYPSVNWTIELIPTVSVGISSMVQFTDGPYVGYLRARPGLS